MLVVRVVIQLTWYFSPRQTVAELQQEALRSLSGQPSKATYKEGIFYFPFPLRGSGHCFLGRQKERNYVNFSFFFLLFPITHYELQIIHIFPSNVTTATMLGNQPGRLGNSDIVSSSLLLLCKLGIADNVGQIDTIQQLLRFATFLFEINFRKVNDRQRYTLVKLMKKGSLRYQQAGGCVWMSKTTTATATIAC